MAIPLLRKLTEKSTLGVGTYKDKTVKFILENTNKSSLYSAYYMITNISFTDEIMAKLKIDEKFRIEKPGKDPEMFEAFKEDRRKS